MHIINGDLATDFTLIALESNIQMEKFILESMLDIMAYESEYMTNCLEAGYIVSEALDEIDVEVKKKRNIVDRIFDAIEALFGSFTEKVKILVNKNEQWLRKNLINVKAKHLAELGELEMYPYWTRTSDKIFADLQNITNDLVNSTKNNQEKFKDIDEIKKVLEKRIGDTKDIATTAKNFFRTGKINGKAELMKLNGKDIATFYPEIYNYCIKYDKVVIPKVNKYMNSMKTTIKNLTKDVTTESFCFLENTSFANTELGLLPDFSMVLEAGEEDKELANGKIDDNKTKLTTVKINGNNDNKDTENNDKKEANSDTVAYCKNLTNVLKILQGAAVTVLEEKYMTYINLLKAVVNNNNKKEKTDEK